MAPLKQVLVYLIFSYFRLDLSMGLNFVFALSSTAYAFEKKQETSSTMSRTLSEPIRMDKPGELLP
jgi:hypothetical protein